MPKQPWTVMQGVIVGAAVGAGYTVFAALRTGSADGVALIGSAIAGAVLGGLFGIAAVKIRNTMVGVK